MIYVYFHGTLTYIRFCVHSVHTHMYVLDYKKHTRNAVYKENWKQTIFIYECFSYMFSSENCIFFCCFCSLCRRCRHFSLFFSFSLSHFVCPCVLAQWNKEMRDSKIDSVVGSEQRPLVLLSIRFCDFIIDMENSGLDQCRESTEFHFVVCVEPYCFEFYFSFERQTKLSSSFPEMYHRNSNTQARLLLMDI